MRLRSCLLGVSLAVLPLAPLAAQSTAPPVPPGARVRVRVDSPPPPRTVIGTVRTIDADTLALAPSGGGAVERVPLTAIDRLEVSRGRGVVASHVLIGALAGAAVGGLLGGAGSSCGGDQWCSLFRGLAVTGGVALGGLVGAGVGALIKGEKWRTVPLEPRASAVPLPGGRVGVGVSLGLRF